MRTFPSAVSVLLLLAFASTAFPGDPFPFYSFSVTVSGAVRNPGEYPCRQGERISSLIARAGGFTESAFPPGGILKRVSVAAYQEVELADLLSRVFPAGNRIQADGNVPKATGRVPIRLAHPRLMKGTLSDVGLEADDFLFIPSATPGVRVTGAVNSPGAFTHKGGLKVDEYVRLAGGYLPGADKQNILLIKADGTVKRWPREWMAWSPERGRWELSAFRPDPEAVEAGDTVAVPERCGENFHGTSPAEITGVLIRIAEIAGQIPVGACGPQ